MLESLSVSVVCGLSCSVYIPVNFVPFFFFTVEISLCSFVNFVKNEKRFSKVTKTLKRNNLKLNKLSSEEENEI